MALEQFAVGTVRLKKWKKNLTEPNLIWPNLTKTNFFSYGKLPTAKNPRSTLLEERQDYKPVAWHAWYCLVQRSLCWDNELFRRSCIGWVSEHLASPMGKESKIYIIVINIGWVSEHLASPTKKSEKYTLEKAWEKGRAQKYLQL